MTLLRSMMLVLCLSAMNVAWAGVELDSLRLENRDDGTFIIHRVESGETLFSIAKRYNGDLAKIAEINKLDGYAINIGQIIEIPVSSEEKLIKNDKSTYHTVKPGETLYAISHIYGVNINELKEWNNLQDNSINEGQILMVGKGEVKISNPVKVVKEEPKIDKDQKSHVVKTGETLYSISKLYDIPVSDLKEWNSLPDNNISVNQTIRLEGKSRSEATISSDDASVATTVKESSQPEVKEAEDNPVVVVDTVSAPPKRKRFDEATNDENTGTFEKVFEKGIAMRIENSPKTKKYLCLHRTLPTGAIIQVKNLMNSQSIFVRVVGTLPDIGGNESVLIRLSDIAYQRLGAIDAKFPVEISYIPE